MKPIEEVLGAPVSQVLSVSRHALDEAWEKQPQYVWAVNEALADANRERDEQKKDAEGVDSKLFAGFTSPADGTKGMAVEKAKAAVASSRESRRAWAEFFEAKATADRLAAMAAALTARQSTLKHLSELYAANYYTSDRSRSTYSTRPRSERG